MSDEITWTVNAFEDEWDGELDAWPNCAMPDCENKACLWGGTGYCHPCSVRLVGRAEMDRRYAATRDPETGGWNGLLPVPPTEP